MNNSISYGVTNQTVCVDVADEIVEDLTIKGFSVIEKIVENDILEVLRQKLDHLNELQEKEFGRENLVKINDLNNVRSPLLYDKEFLKLAFIPEVHNVIRKVFGANYILMMQNGVINDSGEKNYQFKWHRDLNYQHWTSSKCLTLNFLVCLDDFFVEGGCTHVLPGTHKSENFPSEQYIKRNELPLEAPAGSVIIMDSMLYHRGGQNIKQGFRRRGINHVIGLPFFSQQIDIPKNLPEDFFSSLNAQEKNFLGFRWNPAVTPLDWRKQKL